MTVFVAMAIATAVGHRFRPGEPIALLLDAVPIIGVAVATLIATAEFRRVAISRSRLVLSAYCYFAGALTGTLGVGHSAAVVMVAIDRARQEQFVYDFRFYSVVLLGVLLIAGGFVSASHAAEMAQGKGVSWRGSIRVWAAILAINLPLVPLQRFAILFSLLAALALLLLISMRRRVAIP